VNSLDDQLDRLFRAAGRNQPGLVPAPAFGLETRVLAAWRSAPSRETGIWDVALLVRGLILASVIMAVSFWPALKGTDSSTNPFADFLQQTDTTVSSDDAP
jgi:type II secretory pathway component PulM